MWSEKNRPKSLAELTYHADLSQMLTNLAKCPDLPHILFHGPSGAGKKTRVTAMLKEIFGPGAAKIKHDQRTFKINSKTIEINIMSSNYHIEICPSDVGNSDTFVVQELIKEIAESSPLKLGPSTINGFKTFGVQSTNTNKRKGPSFKVVVLHDADKLSKSAQHALRRTMEKFMIGCRIIMISENICSIITPIRSRCLCIPIAAPEVSEIKKCLSSILTKEEEFSSNMSSENSIDLILDKISNSCDRNLRRGILMLQNLSIENDGICANLASTPIESISFPELSWKLLIKEISSKILKSQSTVCLIEVRKNLYELLGNCIPGRVILTELIRNLLSSIDGNEMALQAEIVKAACHFDYRMVQGSKDIFHLEAFIAKFMHIYKNYLIKMFA